MKTPAPLFIADAFASGRFRGNAAAVCLLEAPADAAWMQALAAEMNLSETAFLVPQGDAFSLRWFTPAVEVELCGHATLASAHVLWETGRLDTARPALFDTKSGRLAAVRLGQWIELDFPARPGTPAQLPAGVVEALGCTPLAVTRGRDDFLIEVESEAVVRQLSPDFSVLKTLQARGVIVTARADSAEFDFVSRFFAPAAGVDEDPVTGSAHCMLAPFWGARLDKRSMRAWQASTRGGEVRVDWRGDRVGLAGRCVTVLSGTLA